MAQGPSAAQKAIGDITPKLADLTDEMLFGDVWERTELSSCDRSLITVTALISLYRVDQLGLRFQRALQNGLTEEERPDRGRGKGIDRRAPAVGHQGVATGRRTEQVR
ncbi:carboxymuconolactone decarboxylase family protein, partial [Streptomyces sp. NPDC004561]